VIVDHPIPDKIPVVDQKFVEDEALLLGELHFVEDSLEQREGLLLEHCFLQYL